VATLVEALATDVMEVVEEEVDPATALLNVKENNN
jgi:hypothetical protein